jgi:hypothetical protein
MKKSVRLKPSTTRRIDPDVVGKALGAEPVRVWKGGEFTMDKNSRLWVDNAGTCNGTSPTCAYAMMSYCGVK